jgi:hypothetical protein
LGICGSAVAQGPSWELVEGDMVTRWAKEVTPDNVLPDYPRPAMRRPRWINLNGLWEFAIRPKNETSRPESFHDHILVPFCAESALSGIKRTVRETDRLWYRRTLEVPVQWQGERILLHFGAVDWEATVWVNGFEATQHRGGYEPFSVDITDLLDDSHPQEIVVSVWDPSDKGRQPRGKQVIIPHGFNYTGASGIWQTVWVEPVPPSHIRSVHTVADIDTNCVWVTVDTVGTHDGCILEAKTLLPEPGEGKGTIPIVADGRAGHRLRIRLREHPVTRLWSPDSPYLYDLQITLRDSKGRTIDRVDSYFGMRKIAVEKDENGINRLFLNDRPLFQYGFLDQGWWPDGVYTAPTDAALRYDIETAKRLGANMVRKHVKFEPLRFYHHCDKLGMLVWQDMPNGSDHSPQFEKELKGMIDAARAHPSIVMWVLFNEGWGQHEAARHADWVKRYDPTRLVNHASGWADRGDFGDVRDIHIYDGGPGVSPPLDKRAVVLGEFGGIGWSVSGHEWKIGKGHGHGGKRDDDRDLTEPYLRLIRKLPAMKRLGLCAAVYTQIADQEIEVNGVMTYDREFLKLDAREVAVATRRLFETPPRVKMVLPTSAEAPQTWRFTTERPGKDWYESAFDDSGWKTGRGAFGDFHPTFPTLIVPPRTQWASPDIWIRRTFTLPDARLVSPYVLIHHDEGAEVYFNGKRIFERVGATNYYTWIPMDKEMIRALKSGINTVAVHCHNEHHPQCIDVGIVDVLPAGERGETR